MLRAFRLAGASLIAGTIFVVAMACRWALRVALEEEDARAAP
jgi:hypothetical protein